MLFARIQTPTGPLPFFTTQLTSTIGQSQVRCRQVAALSRFVAAHLGPGFPPVVTGDLNAEPDADEIRLLGGHKTAPVVGIVLFDGVEELHAIGPWEVLSYWTHRYSDDGVAVFTLSPVGGLVRCAKGLRVQADYSFADAPAIEVLVHPGGQGTRPLLGDAAHLAWVRRQRATVPLLTSGGHRHGAAPGGPAGRGGAGTPGPPRAPVRSTTPDLTGQALLRCAWPGAAGTDRCKDAIAGGCFSHD